MLNYTRDNERVYADAYDLFLGMDVDKTSIALSVHDRTGIIKSLKMPYEPQNLLSFVQKNYPQKRIVFAYEAGPTGFGLYDAVAGAGYRCLVVSPGSILSAPNSRVKTNRLDSKKLAEQLAGQQLKGIRIPPQAIRELRSLVHLRYTYMQDIKAYKCRIKAELLNQGLAFPPAPKGSQWSLRVMEALRSLECEAVISYKISSMVDHILYLNKQIKLVESAIRSHVKSNDDIKCCIQYLMSCPGIGWKIACYVLARIGDWRSLGPSKEAGAFFGLVPSEKSTGDSVDRGSITKCGDPRLRSMLIQGAWAAIRKDRELNAFYERICASHSKKVAARVAIVAVARKLAERMHCVLKHQRNYEVHAVA